MSEIKDWPPERLVKERKIAEDELDRLMGQDNLQSAIVANIRSEQDRRAVAHLPIKVGDNVLLTKEIIKKYGGAPKMAGTKLWVQKLWVHQDGEVGVDLGTKARPSYEDVLVMRKAYLEKHPQ